MRITRKGYDDHALLQHPIFKSPHFQTTADKLAVGGITSYSKLIEVVADETTEENLHVTACWTVRNVHEAFNKRYLVTPLLKAAKSSSEEVRGAAVFSLSMLDHPRAASYLIDCACDKQESFSVRTLAMQGLVTNKTPDTFIRLRAIIFDESDDIRSRSEALEWLSYPPSFDAVSDFIKLLQHPLPDLRFWAAYRFSQEHQDITRGLSALDKAAAFDHNVPTTWGWHIDREALMALEGIYWRKFTKRRRYWPHPPTYLISPAPEYDTFIRKHRTFNEDWFYGNLPTERIALEIDPTWLRKKFLAKWPKAELDIRDPKPETYLLDWKVRIGHHTLIGGLHRDQYAVVLSGNDEAIMKFAVWYRSIFAQDQPLFIYEWADPGYELKDNMTPDDIKAAIGSTYNKLTQVTK